jgi:hypothetical protein
MTRIGEPLFRTFPTKTRQVIAKRFVGPREEIIPLREFFAQRLAHANFLTSLSGKNKSIHKVLVPL